MKTGQSTFALPAIMALLGIAQISASLSSASQPIPNSFWFQNKEVFPLEWGIQNVAHADLDQNGREDIVVVENNRAKIHILWNRNPGEPVDLATNFGSSNVNTLPPDARFKMDAITSERRIVDLAIGDLNGDSLPDIAYFGQPDGLVVHFNAGNRKWSTPQEFVVDPGQISLNSLAIGDLNNDSLNDIILLQEGAAEILYQSNDNKLNTPVKIALSEEIRGLLIQDLNNDGQNDLLLLAWESKTPVRIRWQKNGTLGPEIHFKIPAISAYDLADLNNDGIPEITCIESRSNDVCLYQFDNWTKSEILPGLESGQFHMMGLNMEGGVGDSFLWTDINGDKMDDLLIPDPQSGQLLFWQQSDTLHFDSPSKFPSFSGISQITAGDWNNDNSKEIFLLSPDEKSVGVTQLDPLGKIPFPEIIKLKGLPLAIEFGHIQQLDKQCLIAIWEHDESSHRHLEIFHDNKSIHNQILSEDYAGTPNSILIADADHDGLSDILLITPYQDIKILRGMDTGFEELDVAPPGGSSESKAPAIIDFDNDSKPELVFCIKNFIRITKLENTSSNSLPAWSFKVLEQVNGASANSEIHSPILFPDKDPSKTILALLDKSQSQISFLTKDQSNTWKIEKNFPLIMENVLGMETIALNNQPGKSITVHGSNFVAWLAADSSSKSLVRKAQYQTKINRGKLFDLISGDINNDGRNDIVFNEAQLNHIEIASVADDLTVVPAVNWKVFEKQSFRSGPGAAGEPREMAIADFTSDGKKDLLILVHDRLILYPQD